MRKACLDLLSADDDLETKVEVACKFYKFGTFIHHLSFLLFANASASLHRELMEDLQSKIEEQAETEANEEIKRLIADFKAINPLSNRFDMARRKIDLPKPNPQEWQLWVRWPTKEESLRIFCKPAVAQYWPGVVILQPSKDAPCFVTGMISKEASDELAGGANEPATTVMNIHAGGKDRGTFRIPNKAVLCYGDFSFLSPEFQAIKVPSELQGFDRFDSLATYALWGLYSEQVPEVTRKGVHTSQPWLEKLAAIRAQPKPVKSDDKQLIINV